MDKNNNDLFENNEPGKVVQKVIDDETTDFVKQLVGEGMKFRDVNQLAKGKIESDSHIKNLEAELANIRKDLNTRLTLEEFMEKLDEKQSYSEAPSKSLDTREISERDRTEVGKQISKEEIASLIKQELSTEKQKANYESNIDYVKSELIRTWGNDYKSKLVDKAKELELGQEFLSSLAATNPKAFLKLVAVTDQLGINLREDPNIHLPPVSSYNPPTATDGTVNISPGGKSWKGYYEKMRKENPREYWTTRVQRELHESAKKHGEAFYKS